MELVPQWLAIVSLIASSAILITLGIGSIFRRNRAIFRLGTRYSNSHRKESIAKAFPVALLTAIVLSSLSVGDGLFQMVEENTDQNLSRVDVVIEASGFITEDLLGTDSDFIHAPVISLSGTGRSVSTRSRPVNIMGVNGQIFKMGEFRNILGEMITEEIPGNEVVLNKEASELLNVEKGNWIVLGANQHDRSDYILLSSGGEGKVLMNLTVADIIENSGIGRYREDAIGDVEPLAFVSLTRFQERLDKVGEVNRFLIDMKGGFDVEDLGRSIENNNDISNLGFSSIEGSINSGTFLISEEFFFDEKMIEEVQGQIPTMSYFVDSLASDENELSYSVITGMDIPISSPGSGEIFINNWTAEHLDVEKGESIEIEYRKLNSYGILETDSRVFEVSRIVNISGFHEERNYLPPIEGVTSEISCSDWEPDFEVNISSIPDSEYEYWKLYSTTPKGFISLEDAREMWSNSWGDSTAILYPDNSSSILDKNIDIEYLDISIIPVRENALSSSRAMSIFPAMFLTFGMTIVISTAMVLYAVLTDLAGRMNRDRGILRAIGVNRRNVVLFGLYENIRPILVGGLLGIFLGYGLSFIMGFALEGIWSETVEGSSVPFALSFSSVAVAFSSGFILSFIMVAFAILKEVIKTPTANVRDDPSVTGKISGKRFIIPLVGVFMIVAGIILSTLMMEDGSTFEIAGPFVMVSVLFSTGATLLMIFIVSRKWGFSDIALYSSASISRRPGRTMIGAILLAMVLTLSLTLTGFGGILESNISGSSDTYGGGFDMIMETSTGLEGTEIDLDEIDGMDIVPILSYGKEGGTCSNINAVYPPRLLGLSNEILSEGGFSSKVSDEKIKTPGNDLLKLTEKLDGKIPIYVDENTLTWIYFGSLGSIFEIEPTPGIFIELQVIGILDPSVLTGTFVMKEEFLKEIYPSASTYDLFLVKGEPSEENIRSLEEHFSDLGPKIELVDDRAREELEYELSYLSLFRDYLLLGVVVALVAVAIFNHSRALRFKKEISILRSIGIDRKRAFIYIFSENTISLSIAYIGSILGSILTIIFSISTITDEADLAGSIFGPLVLLFILLALGSISTFLSSIWATKDHERMLPGSDA